MRTPGIHASGRISWLGQISRTNRRKSDLKKLSRRLQHWDAMDLDTELPQNIFGNAPTVIVMPEARIDMAFW
jgi:hypothetical protein